MSGSPEIWSPMPPHAEPTERLTQEQVRALAGVLVRLARSYADHLERQGVSLEQLEAEHGADG